MKNLIKFLVGVVVFAMPLFSLAQTGERIISFHSEIEVFKDSSVEVLETIRVVSSGDQIKRGIYRDFPIAYKDSLGQRYLVDFELLSVRRDGSAESYHIEKAGNGLRIYIGKEDVFLQPGEYEYQIAYKIKRVLGYFEDHDELYWNVTGNGWVFPIEQASASVRLPEGVPFNSVTAILYTGPQGSTEKAGSFQVGKGGLVEFQASRPLGSYEGLTIVAGWPKGFVQAPTAGQNFMASLKSNLDFIVGILGLVLLFVYYYRAWDKKGRDPKKGTVIALYEPPLGHSPAFLRHISRMGSDNRSFSAAIIDLGVKGRLSITEEKTGLLKKTEYILTKSQTPEGDVLAEEERLLLEGLFKSGEVLKMEASNAAEISKLKTEFVESLKKQEAKKYFVKNHGALVFGILLSVIFIACAILAANTFRFGVESWLQVVFWPALVLGMLAQHILFGWLLRAYTPEGRKLADEIEGFKLFLSVTEKDRLSFHNPPEKTPQLFEKMLPFALALGVEHKWAEQFADVFARMKTQGVSYAPVWYYGALGGFDADNFASRIGNTFTGAVASATTPPGSSSGFSGGSGGGGGGGGGGGW